LNAQTVRVEFLGRVIKNVGTLRVVVVIDIDRPHAGFLKKERPTGANVI
jgi:hypothetical protein